MSGSANCGGNCASCGGCSACGGCGGTLLLTPEELRILEALSQIPFLPVARRADSMTPVCLEAGMPDSGIVLECLEKKGLISLDYDRPLKNMDSTAYAAYPIQGSMALTGRGQAVVELLEIQGAQPE